MVLFTVAEFKELEGIADTRLDAVITTLATTVSALVDRYCRRTIEESTYTEEIDGTGTSEIMVSVPPLTAVSSVKITSLRDFAGTTSLGAGEFVFEPSGLIRILPTAELTTIVALNAPIFFRGNRNIEIQYTGGFATIPADLKQGAMMWASYLLLRRRKVGLTSHTLGPQTLTWQSRQVPMEVEAILGSYRLAPLFAGRKVS